MEVRFVRAEPAIPPVRVRDEKEAMKEIARAFRCDQRDLVRWSDADGADCVQPASEPADGMVAEITD